MAARARVLVLPVTRDRWALHWLPSHSVGAGGAHFDRSHFGVLGHERANESKSSSTHSTTSQAHAEHVDGRLQRLIEKAKTRAASEWDELSRASPSSLRGRAYTALSTLMSRMDPIESFLVNITPPPAAADLSAGCIHRPLIEFVYPARLNEKLVRRRLRLLANAASRDIDARFRAWCYAVPLTFSLGIIPGPNIFLAWNAFRCQSLWRARRGSQGLRDILAFNHASFVPSAGIVLKATAAAESIEGSPTSIDGRKSGSLGAPENGQQAGAAHGERGECDHIPSFVGTEEIEATAALLGISPGDLSLIVRQTKLRDPRHPRDLRERALQLLA